MKNNKHNDSKTQYLSLEYVLYDIEILGSKCESKSSISKKI